MTVEQPIRFGARPERVLVTGATGFIGRLLVRALLADGHQVTALTRSQSRARRVLGAQVQCVDRLAALPASTAFDTVINLAGARILGWPWTEQRRTALLASRVGLTRALVEWIALAQHKPRLLLSASAIGYYGVQAPGDTTALAEDSPPQPIFMSQLCCQWEQAAAAAAAHGVPVVCMRFGLVLGRGGALPMMLLPIRLGLGGPLGHGDQWVSWIHVQDLLRALAHVWHIHAGTEPTEKHGKARVLHYNFTAPVATSQRAFSQTAARVLHRPAFLPTPAWPLRLVLGEQADLLLEGQRVVPAALMASDFGFTWPSLQGALEDLIRR